MCTFQTEEEWEMSSTEMTEYVVITTVGRNLSLFFFLKIILCSVVR